MFVFWCCFSSTSVYSLWYFYLKPIFSVTLHNFLYVTNKRGTTHTNAHTHLHNHSLLHFLFTPVLFFWSLASCSDVIWVDSQWAVQQRHKGLRSHMVPLINGPHTETVIVQTQQDSQIVCNSELHASLCLYFLFFSLWWITHLNGFISFHSLVYYSAKCDINVLVIFSLKTVLLLVRKNSFRAFKLSKVFILKNMYSSYSYY